MAKCPYGQETVTLSDTHCENKASDDVHNDALGTSNKEIMSSCPHCRNVLGLDFLFGGISQQDVRKPFCAHEAQSLTAAAANLLSRSATPIIGVMLKAISPATSVRG